MSEQLSLIKCVSFLELYIFKVLLKNLKKNNEYQNNNMGIKKIESPPIQVHKLHPSLQVLIAEN